MVFKGINMDGEWVCVEYAATWRYGFDFMLDAAKAILSDLANNLQRFARYKIIGGKPEDIVEDVKKCKGDLRSCEALKEECGAIAVAGVSGIMECPMQIVFFNQTNKVLLDCPIKGYFEEHGEHVFDNYMNSIEINAYCADTKRRTLAEKADQT